MANSVQLLVISSDKLEKLHGRLSKADKQLIKTVTKEFRTFGKGLQEEARREAPVQTGKLRDSIKYKLTNADTSKVAISLYAGNNERPEVVVRTVLLGSRPHEIRPKKPNGVLVFNSYRGSKVAKRGGVTNIKLKGGLVFTRRVHHPGTKPNDFLGRAFNTMQPTLDNMLKRIGRLTIDFITEE